MMHRFIILIVLVVVPRAASGRGSRGPSNRSRISSSSLPTIWVTESSAVMGTRGSRTPNLDRMAAEGVRLTQFNTPMPFCAPTRASLLTGRYPFRCGLTDNPAPDGGPVADAVGLPLDEVTLAQLLRKAGYATGMVGKWHLGHKRPEYLPTHRGFDEYLGIPYSNDMRPVRLLDGEKEVEYPVVQATLTWRYTERAPRFIERNRDRPFFLYFAHAMPHKPLACSEAFYKKSGAGLYGDVIAELDCERRPGPRQTEGPRSGPADSGGLHQR